MFWFLYRLLNLLRQTSMLVLLISKETLLDVQAYAAPW